MNRLARVLAAGLLLLAPTLASPAQDLFDEASYYLSILYGGKERPKLPGLIRKYQASLEEACQQKADCPLEVGMQSARAMLEELGDPHTGLLLPEEYRGLGLVPGDAPQGRRGLGLLLAAPSSKAGLVVLGVLPGSPAEAAGLRRGDRVLGLDGRLLLGQPQQRLAAFTAVQDGEAEVTLNVLRQGEGRTMRLRPALLEIPTARLELLPGGVAYLSIFSFASGQVAQSVNALVKQALQNKARGLVLDLRNNGGGLVAQQLLVSEIFTDRPGRRLQSALAGEVELRNQSGQLRQTDRSGEHVVAELSMPVRWQGPLVVLVNQSTVSAAEFLALDLQQAGFPVIGEPTYGVADTAVSFIRLSSGVALAITTSQVRRPDGQAYPPRVVPDVAVADDLEALITGHDPLLDWALQRLGGVHP